jgi:HopA1 effector protein family
MTSTRQIVENIVKGVRIEPSRKLIYRDAEVNMFGYDSSNTISTDMLFESLQQTIYNEYSMGGMRLPNMSLSRNDKFIDELRLANKTIEGWDTAWTVNSIDSRGAYHVKKGNYSRYAYPGEFIKESFHHGTIKEGDKLRLLVRKEFYDDGQPFYFLFGNTIGEDQQQFQFRFYFNVAYHGAGRLVEAITSSFNDYSIPFQFKCMAMAEGYQRCDTAVMYLDKRYFAIAAEIIRRFYPQLEGFLRPECPLFTRRMAGGWSFAESPLNVNESFGTSRARVIARMIVDCFIAGVDSSLWPGEVVSRIEASGHSLERFYLNADSSFPYNFDIDE